MVLFLRCSYVWGGLISGVILFLGWSSYFWGGLIPQEVLSLISIYITNIVEFLWHVNAFCGNSLSGGDTSANIKVSVTRVSLGLYITCTCINTHQTVPTQSIL